MKRIKGYVIIGIVCLVYWMLDSVWSYLSFEHNLKNLIFSEPGSYLDTFLLKVPPYQIVSRLMVVILFVATGILIIEFLIRRDNDEIERKQAHDTFLTVLNSIDATIYVADIHDHEILFMNKFMVDIFGGDYAGKTCYEFFRNKASICDHCKNDRLLDASGNPVGLIVWEGYNSVTNTWHMNYDRAITWIDGRTVHLQIATNITQLKEIQTIKDKANEQLRQAQKMESIGNLAGGIAHDFNNILFPIIGMAEMLLEDLPAASIEHENTEEILKAGLRGRDLVRQILAFSRQSEHRIAPTRIQHILKEVLTLARSTIPADIKIHQDVQPDCGLVMADATQIHQVAMNILTNAYHAVEAKGGEISIQLKETQLVDSDQNDIDLEPGKYAVLSISDTGHGMPPGLVDRIFDPYFTTKPQGKGTGLGLAVVHGIVREHKGTVQVSSEAEKGTTFCVYLPLMKNTDSITSADAIETQLSGTERILLVDDEKAVVKLEKQMLERLGYHVTERYSSADALEAFKANPSSYDLVLTDMAMPNMTGDQLARALLSIRKDIPIIICTGFSERINQEKARSYGIKDVLMKPIVKSEMARMIRRALDEAHV